MINIKVERGKDKTCTINPAELMSLPLHEVVSKKTGKDVTQDAIISFDGKKVVYTDGNTIELSIPEADLLKQNVTQWVQKHLKTRSKMHITFLKTKGK